MSNDILHGWNEIAEFLSCDVRTAKRWEKQRGLPIRRTRRTPGEGRANVHALISEIGAWQASATPANENGSNPTVEPPQLEASKHLRLRGPLGLAGLCLSLIAMAFWVHRFASARTGTHEPRVEATASGGMDSSGSMDGAKELFLRGSYMMEQRTPQSLRQARLEFEQLMASNPQYAPAYTGLAMTYNLLREYSTLPSSVAFPKAKEAALRAIALDPGQADAHAALGYEEFFWEWKAAEAEREFKKAISLAPDNATCRHWYGSMLMHQARFEEALEQLNRAQMLEPSSASILSTRAYAMGLSGRRDEAVDILQGVLDRTPDATSLHFVLAQLSLQEPRDIPRYLDQTRLYAQSIQNNEAIQEIDAASAAYRKHGERGMWQDMLRAEDRRLPSSGRPSYAKAQLEAELGLRDAALRDLAVLANDHDPMMIGVKIDVLLRPLQGDPQFEQILAGIGLPPGRERSASGHLVAN